MWSNPPQAMRRLDTKATKVTKGTKMLGEIRASANVLAVFVTFVVFVSNSRFAAIEAVR